MTVSKDAAGRHFLARAMQVHGHTARRRASSWGQRIGPPWYYVALRGTQAAPFQAANLLHLRCRGTAQNHRPVTSVAGRGRGRLSSSARIQPTRHSPYLARLAGATWVAGRGAAWHSRLGSARQGAAPRHGAARPTYPGRGGPHSRGGASGRSPSARPQGALAGQARPARAREGSRVLEGRGAEGHRAGAARAANPA